jgi:hypothetical protein
VCREEQEALGPEPESSARHVSKLTGLALVPGALIFLPDNIERHVLDRRDVRFQKVRALKVRLLNIRPKDKVFVLEGNLDWQRCARLHSKEIDSIAQCDVIVDGTGHTPTSLFLGAIASENERAFVSCEVYEGGLMNIPAAVLGAHRKGIGIGCETGAACRSREHQEGRTAA